MSFREIKIEELNINPITMISKDWFLITAGNDETGYNTMTAAWGSIGDIWDRKVEEKRTPYFMAVRPPTFSRTIPHPPYSLKLSVNFDHTA